MQATEAIDSSRGDDGQASASDTHTHLVQWQILAKVPLSIDVTLPRIIPVRASTTKLQK